MSELETGNGLYNEAPPATPPLDPDPPPANGMDKSSEASPQDPPEPEQVETDTDTPAEPSNDDAPAETFVSSIDELIETQEWDKDWFNSLKLPVTVDHETSEVPLSEIVNNYRVDKAAENRLDEAKAKAKTIVDEVTEKQQALEGQYATLGKLVENAEKLLDADTAAVDWQKLREDDPAEYSAKKAEITERREKISQMKREAVESYQSTAQEQQQKAQEQLEETLKAEGEKLLEKVPEWRDEEKAKAEKSDLRKELVSRGFSEKEIAQAYDHRLVLMARDAMLYRKGQSDVDTAKKKVAKRQKVMKPGAKSDTRKETPKDPARILYG